MLYVTEVLWMLDSYAVGQEIRQKVELRQRITAVFRSSEGLIVQ